MLVMHLHTYIVLDGARLHQNLGVAKAFNSKHQSLYKGKVEEYLQDVSPYLFACSAETELARWYVNEGWGKAWGIGICTDQNFENVYKHLRRFLMIKTENNKQLYFRFYDPRVLGVFLPTCSKEQVMDFFGPVKSFIVEDELTIQAIEFSHENGELKQRLIPVEEAWKETEERVTDKQQGLLNKSVSVV